LEPVCWEVFEFKESASLGKKKAKKVVADSAVDTIDDEVPEDEAGSIEDGKIIDYITGNQVKESPKEKSASESRARSSTNIASLRTTWSRTSKSKLAASEKGWTLQSSKREATTRSKTCTGL